MELDTELLEALGVDYPGLESTVEEGPDWGESFAIARSELEGLASRYTDFIKLSPTDVVCLCEWLVHPDDVDLPVGKRRVKRSKEHPRCKQHTSIGFLLGFFEFVFAEPEGIVSTKDECADGCDYAVTGYHAVRGGKRLCGPNAPDE